MKDWDAIVIGASAGGLAAAAYLARGGSNVIVLEAEAAPAEPIGALHALDPQMIAELKLIARGLRFMQRDLPLTLPGETPLALGRDGHAVTRALASISGADAKAWPVFHRELFSQARYLRRFWWSTLKDGAPHWALESNAQKEAFDRLCLTGADAYLRGWFESDALVSALMWDATGGGLAPNEPGSALTLVWRAAQEMAGLQGAVAIPAPGTLMTALKAAAEGAQLRAYARVKRINCRAGAVTGVTLDDGEEIAAPLVLSALTGAVTLSLMGGATPLPAAVGEARLLLAVAAPHALTPARTVIADRPDAYQDAHEAARAGTIPAELPLEFIPVDLHHIAVTVRPVPVLAARDWQAQMAARAIRAIGRHVPGLAANISHIAFARSTARASLAQMTAPAGARIRTGTEGLYLCGTDAEPVPSLSGRAARIAASYALERQ